MFRYYFSIGIMCVIFAVFSLLLSSQASGEMLATIFIGIGGGFLAIAFITATPDSRW